MEHNIHKGHFENIPMESSKQHFRSVLSALTVSKCNAFKLTTFILVSNAYRKCTHPTQEVHTPYVHSKQYLCTNLDCFSYLYCRMQLNFMEVKARVGELPLRCFCCWSSGHFTALFTTSALGLVIMLLSLLVYTCHVLYYVGI